MVFSVFAFFSVFVICDDINQPVLEKAMPFVYLFRDFSACIGQIRKFSLPFTIPPTTAEAFRTL